MSLNPYGIPLVRHLYEAVDKGVMKPLFYTAASRYATLIHDIPAAIYVDEEWGSSSSGGGGTSGDDDGVTAPAVFLEGNYKLGSIAWKGKFERTGAACANSHVPLYAAHYGILIYAADNVPTTTVRSQQKPEEQKEKNSSSKVRSAAVDEREDGAAAVVVDIEDTSSPTFDDALLAAREEALSFFTSPTSSQQKPEDGVAEGETDFSFLERKEADDSLLEDWYDVDRGESSSNADDLPPRASLNGNNSSHKETEKCEQPETTREQEQLKEETSKPEDDEWENAVSFERASSYQLIGDELKQSFTAGPQHFVLHAIVAEEGHKYRRFCGQGPEEVVGDDKRAILELIPIRYYRKAKRAKVSSAITRPTKVGKEFFESWLLASSVKPSIRSVSTQPKLPFGSCVETAGSFWQFFLDYNKDSRGKAEKYLRLTTFLHTKQIGKNVGEYLGYDAPGNPGGHANNKNKKEKQQQQQSEDSGQAKQNHERSETQNDNVPKEETNPLSQSGATSPTGRAAAPALSAKNSVAVTTTISYVRYGSLDVTQMVKEIVQAQFRGRGFKCADGNYQNLFGPAPESISSAGNSDGGQEGRLTKRYFVIALSDGRTFSFEDFEPCDVVW